MTEKQKFEVLWHREDAHTGYNKTELEAKAKPTLEEAAHIVSVIEDQAVVNIRVDGIRKVSNA